MLHLSFAKERKTLKEEHSHSSSSCRPPWHPWSPQAQLRLNHSKQEHQQLITQQRLSKLFMILYTCQLYNRAKKSLLKKKKKKKKNKARISCTWDSSTSCGVDRIASSSCGGVKDLFETLLGERRALNISHCANLGRKLLSRFNRNRSLIVW